MSKRPHHQNSQSVATPRSGASHSRTERSASVSQKLRARAESLIETIVAITVIVFTATASGSLLRISIQGSESLERKIIALNLAEEALGALVNMRDSNYLQFASDPDNCWNKLNITDVSECSLASSDEIEEGLTYTLTRNYDTEPFLGWNLSETTAISDGSLSLYEVNTGAGGTPLYAESGISVTGFSAIEDDIFTRTLTVAYACGGNCYNATVTVGWRQGSLDQSISVTGSVAHVY